MASQPREVPQRSELDAFVRKILEKGTVRLGPRGAPVAGEKQASS